MFSRRAARNLFSGAPGLICLVLLLCTASFPLLAQSESQQPVAVPSEQPAAPATSVPAASPEAQSAAPQAVGSISGTVIDQTGAVAVGAHVELTREGPSPKQEVLSGDNGQFSFSNLPAGPFLLSISASGFANGVYSGELHPGEAFIVPEIMLSVANAVTDVRVGVDTEEVAEIQVKEQEKQRVFGIVPNFYVSYIPDAAHLRPKQKFSLAWKSSIDPVTIVGVGFLAGLEQAADDYGGYGQGASGYFKRFGAAYGDVFIGTFVDSAILTSLFKQDPRYFYQGTGSTSSRLKHALANSIICKGDNHKNQLNYSAIVGAFVTGGISYLYYPPSDRGAGLLAQTAAVRIALGSVAGVFQEFVFQKMTTHSRAAHDASQP